MVEQPVAIKPVVKTVTAKAPAVSPKAQSSPSNTAEIKQIIVKWADYYGTDASRLLRVAACESDFQTTVVNRRETPGNSPSGLFQFKPQTYSSYAAQAGIAGSSIWDAESQARTAAWAFSHGKSGAWECR